ncbi:MAG: AmpG family muropeptide MFS transporter [Gammaproteobacteria bacterium]
MSKNWRTSLGIYRDARMAKILLLGFISGLPWLFIATMLFLWLKEEGLSRTGIGLFGLVFSVYAVNALWAPLVDSSPIPWLTRWLGQRRGWIIAMQGVIILGLLGVAGLSHLYDLIVAALFNIELVLINIGLLDTIWLPDGHGESQPLVLLSLLIFLIALASATQDVAIDALRIEMIRRDEPEKVGAGSAMATSGWWLGFGGSKALALPLVHWMQGNGVADAWQAGYLAMVVVVVISSALLILFVRQKTDQSSSPQEEQTAVDAPDTSAPAAPSGNIIGRAVSLYIAPIKSFITQYPRELGVLLLLFIFLFKIGEAFLGRMSAIFYKEVGFSISEIGLLSGGLGTLTICVFAVMGSFINARYGLYRGILLGGIAMASTNLLFALLAIWPERWLFIIAVVADQFTAAVSTVAFVAFLSQLCSRAYAATQYAAMSSIGNLSRTTLAASSGLLVDSLGGNWPLFFVLTVMMAAPALLILVSQKNKLAPFMRGAETKLL